MPARSPMRFENVACLGTYRLPLSFAQTSNALYKALALDFAFLPTSFVYEFSQLVFIFPVTCRGFDHCARLPEATLLPFKAAFDCPKKYAWKLFAKFLSQTQGSFSLSEICTWKGTSLIRRQMP